MFRKNFVCPNDEIIEEMYLKHGATMRSVGEALGISSACVCRHLHRRGTPIKEKPDVKRIVTPETRKRIGEKHRGKVLSEETRRKISAARTLHGIGHLKTRSDGYIYVYYPDHPCASADGYIMQHRFIMEQHIGRYLEKNEVVHHINHKRDDNRIENLQLMTFEEHASLHMKERHERRRALKHE